MGRSTHGVLVVLPNSRPETVDIQVGIRRRLVEFGGRRRGHGKRRTGHRQRVCPQGLWVQGRGLPEERRGGMGTPAYVPLTGDQPSPGYSGTPGGLPFLGRRFRYWKNLYQSSTETKSVKTDIGSVKPPFYFFSRSPSSHLVSFGTGCEFRHPFLSSRSSGPEDCVGTEVTRTRSFQRLRVSLRKETMASLITLLCVPSLWGRTGSFRQPFPCRRTSHSKSSFPTRNEIGRDKVRSSP